MSDPSLQRVDPGIRIIFHDLHHLFPDWFGRRNCRFEQDGQDIIMILVLFDKALGDLGDQGFTVFPDQDGDKGDGQLYKGSPEQLGDDGELFFGVYDRAFQEEPEIFVLPANLLQLQNIGIHGILLASFPGQVRKVTWRNVLQL